MSEWSKEHAWKVCIRQRIGGSNPPLTAIFEEELVRKYGLFFRILHLPDAVQAPYPAYKRCMNRRPDKRSAIRKMQWQSCRMAASPNPAYTESGVFLLAAMQATLLDRKSVV